MSGSKKISELTTATVLTGSELVPIVQDGETRQVDVSLFGAFAPVLQVNGQTGLVVLALADLSGETIVRNEIVSATFTSVNAAHTSVVDAITSINTAITSVNAAHTSVVDAITSVNTVITSVNAAHTSVVNAITSINTVVDAVSVLTSINAASITSVQAYLLSQISVATSGGITDAPSDGTVYGRKDGSWEAIQVLATITTVSGTTHVPTTGVAGRYFLCVNAATCSVELPTSATQAIPIGSMLTYQQNSSGANLVTFAGAVGVTLRIPPSRSGATAEQYAVAQVAKIAADEWVVYGNLAAV